MRWLVILLLAGCTSYDDLLATATSCGAGPECQELWDEINKLDEIRERREGRDANPCPKGYVHVIDHLGGEGCMTSAELRQIFR